MLTANHFARSFQSVRQPSAKWLDLIWTSRLKGSCYIVNTYYYVQRSYETFLFMRKRRKPIRRIKIFPRLSRRESEILTWVARGKTNADIGEILGISRRTVDTLLSRSYQKLGVENRTAAVMCIIDLILVSM